MDLTTVTPQPLGGVKRRHTLSGRNFARGHEQNAGALHRKTSDVGAAEDTRARTPISATRLLHSFLQGTLKLLELRELRFNDRRLRLHDAGNELEGLFILDVGDESYEIDSLERDAC